MKQLKLSDLEKLIECNKKTYKIARDIVIKSIQLKELHQGRQRTRDPDEEKVLNKFKKK